MLFRVPGYAARNDSQPLDGLSAHDELFLREQPLEPRSKPFPPRAVELLDHHFVDDDVVARLLPAVLAPQSLGRRPRVGRQAAEAAGELVANARIVRRGKGVS